MDVVPADGFLSEESGLYETKVHLKHAATVAGVDDTFLLASMRCQPPQWQRLLLPDHFYDPKIFSNCTHIRSHSLSKHTSHYNFIKHRRNRTPAQYLAPSLCNDLLSQHPQHKPITSCQSPTSGAADTSRHPNATRTYPPPPHLHTNLIYLSTYAIHHLLPQRQLLTTS